MRKITFYKEFLAQQNHFVHREVLYKCNSKSSSKDVKTYTTEMAGTYCENSSTYQITDAIFESENFLRTSIKSKKQNETVRISNEGCCESFVELLPQFSAFQQLSRLNTEFGTYFSAFTLENSEIFRCDSRPTPLCLSNNRIPRFH